MRQDQKKYLNERLQVASSKKCRYLSASEEKEPAPVVRAREVIEQWDAKMSKALEAMRRDVQSAETVVAETILFGDANKALAALKAFERKVFKPAL